MAEGKTKEALADDFFYEKDAIAPLGLLKNELPRNSIALDSSIGFDFKKRNNLQYLDDETICYSTGNVLQILNLTSGKLRHIFGKNSDGIGCVCVHPSRDFFAVGEKGPNPNIMIYEYPSLRLHRVLKQGTEMGYSCMNFSFTGEKLASVGMAPDYMLTVWNWKLEKIILRTKAFAQDIYNVIFSPESDGRLVTGGMGHIRFWKMASTFTGLKLQGAIGKFGRVDLSDVSAFDELPDGKVLSGSERGMLLLWEGNFIKSEISMPKGVLPHQGDIIFIKYLKDEGRFITAGADGYVRQWPFNLIDEAEPSDEEPIIEIEPLATTYIGDGVELCGMIIGNNNWILEDKNGKIWKYDLAAESCTCLKDFHSGPVNAVATSPVDHFSATAGEDGTIRCWDYIDKNCIYSKKFSTAATALAWAPASVDEKCRIVCAGFAGGVIRVLMRGKDEWKTTFVCKPHNKRVTGIKFSPDGKTICTHGEDNTIFFLRVVCASDNKVTLEPVGFQELAGEPLSLDWRHDSEAVLTTSTQGDVVEFTTPKEVDTHHTFELKLESREFTYKPKPTMQAVAVVEGEDSKEEKDDAENPFEVAKAVSKAVQAKYIPGSLDKFHICLDGEEKGIMMECVFDGEYASDEIESHNSIVTSLSTTSSGKFLISTGEDGCVRLRSADDTLTRYFANVRMHDANYGTVNSATTSFDDKYLLTAGADGAVFTFRLQPERLLEAAKEAAAGQAARDAKAAMLKSIIEMQIDAENGQDEAPTEVFGTVVSSLEGDVHDTQAEENASTGVSDIVDPNAYSIQDAKLKTEHDNLVKASEKKKELVRQKIQKLRKKFDAFLESNNEEEEGRRLSKDELVLDQSYKASLVDIGDAKCEEVKKELEYSSTMKDMLIDKMKSKYLSNIAVEGITLKAFEGKFSVDSFRINQLSEGLQESLRAVHALIDAEEDARRRAGKGAILGATSTSTSGGGGGVDVGDNFKGFETIKLQGDGNRNAQQEERKLMRAARKVKIDAMVAKKPSPKAEDPRDLAAIDYARKNMGDCKLKTDKDYVVPEDQRVNAEKKRRQMVLLEESIHAIKMGYNQRYLALRELKRRIVENIKEDNKRMKEIDVELGEEGNRYWEPEMTASEWPENRMKITEEEIEAYAKEKGIDISSNSNKDAEAGGISSTGIDASATSVSTNDITIVPSISAGVGSNTCNAETDGDASQLEEIVSAEARTRFKHEHRVLKEKIKQTVSAFDEAVFDLRREKIKLDADLKSAEMRMLTFFEELNLLKVFAKKDTQLANRLEKAKTQKSEIVNEIQKCRENMDLKKTEIGNWQEKDKIIEGEFKALVPDSNQFRPILEKIYRRKIKRSKKKGDDDGSDDEGSDYESSEEESSSDDEGSDDDDEDEDDSCPVGCDQALYDRVLEMREKRLDQEDVLNDFKKGLEDIKKTHDRMVIKQKTVDKELIATERDIVKFQTEKQQELNRIFVTVSLQISQILCMIDPTAVEDEEGGDAPVVANNSTEGLVLPSSLRTSLVFSHETLDKLRGRREEMLGEVDVLKKKFKSLHGTKRRLQKEKKLRQKEIEKQEARCVELQMLKFGQLIDLASLDQMGDRKMVDDLNKKIAGIETKYERELHKIKKGIKAVKEQMLKTIQDNTANLERIAALTGQQQTLEKELNTKGSAPGAAGGLARQEIEERRRLVQLVKLQAKEVDALKAEINMLRRKGGHVYTPAVSAPGMGEMGDMGPELDDEMIMQQQQQMIEEQQQQ